MKINFSDINSIIRSSDSEFIDHIAKLNSFSLNRRKRRFKYRTTNENVDKLAKHLSLRNDQAMLSISGSGVQLFEFLSRKSCPRLIVAFDYSPKQIAYNFLLKNGIENFSFSQFRDYFGVSGKRLEDCKLTRVNLIKSVPREVRRNLPRNHCFGKKDIFLNRQNKITWIRDRKRYENLKRNINKIKFFSFEISHHNTNLYSIFKKPTFDVVYLSNVLDWICWHNSDVDKITPLVYICNDIAKILRKGGYIIISNLAIRSSLVPKTMENLRAIKLDEEKVYKYRWINYKMYVK